MTDRLLNMIIRHEGMELKPYRCPAGRLTIGVGRNIEDNGISEEEARFMLKNDVARVKKELKRFQFYDFLDDVRMDALTDMLFNLGLTRFSKFKRMIAALDAKDWTTAADEMLNSRWAAQVGSRAYRLSSMVSNGVRI